MKKEVTAVWVMDEKGEFLVIEGQFESYMSKDADCKENTHVLLNTYKNSLDMLCGRNLTHMIFPIEQVYFRKVIIED